MTRIKFCGITRPEDAELAVELEAWAVGMIFWPGSPRPCDPGVAVGIGRTLRRQIELAGVFVNAPLGDLAELADAAGLSLIQLHGDEGPAYCAEVARRTGCRVIKAVRVRTAAELRALRTFHTDFHLLDTARPGQYGGTGQTWDWGLLRGYDTGAPVLLSGGLTPENAAEAIATSRPYGLDVSSGVEASPGVKDPDKMRAFVSAVHEIDPPAPKPMLASERPPEPEQADADAAVEPEAPVTSEAEA